MVNSYKPESQYSNRENWSAAEIRETQTAVQFTLLDLPWI